MGLKELFRPSKSKIIITIALFLLIEIFLVYPLSTTGVSFNCTCVKDVPCDCPTPYSFLEWIIFIPMFAISLLITYILACFISLIYYKLYKLS